MKKYLCYMAIACMLCGCSVKISIDNKSNATETTTSYTTTEETTSHITTIANSFVSKKEEQKKEEEIRQDERNKILSSNDVYVTYGDRYVEDVDSEVKKIRQKYYTTQNNLNSLAKSETGKYTIYKNSNGNTVKIDFPIDNSNYNACFYYDDNILYFAFIFDNNKENRFYFYNNCIFRWIDENGAIFDNEENNSKLNNWDKIIQNESDKAKYASNGCGQ